LLTSARGAQGGYSLARSADDVSVAEIIIALEGPIAITECVSDEHQCDQESHCEIQTNWARINNAVFTALDEVKLADMLTPSNTGESPIHFYPSAKQKDATIQTGEVHG
jgi:Rrf2 family protein